MGGLTLWVKESSETPVANQMFNKLLAAISGGNEEGRGQLGWCLNKHVFRITNDPFV